MITNPLRHCLSGETADIIDQILGPFLLAQLGKNDMSVVNGLMASAAILIAAHCQRTGEDPQEVGDLGRNSFDLALKIASDSAP